MDAIIFAMIGEIIISLQIYFFIHTIKPNFGLHDFFGAGINVKKKKKNNE